MISLDRHALLHQVSHMALENPSNWCFANSAVYALLWTTLSFREFNVDTWGQQHTALYRFVSDRTSSMGNVSFEPWFQAVLRIWGRSDMDQLMGSISQLDAAEFVRFWLDQMQTDAFDMAWERRVEENGAIHVIDQCSGNMPLFFQFAPIDLQTTLFDLSTLANRWRQVDGMSAGLVTAPNCICIHIDRCMQLPNGQLTKCESQLQPLADCLIPILQDDSVLHETMDYTVTALMAHLGGDACGHYRSALRITPSVTNQARPIAWLLTDDWNAPTCCWKLPNWFLKNVTLVWAVRSDKVDLHAFSTLPPSRCAAQDPVDAMLELLKDETKTNMSEV